MTLIKVTDLMKQVTDTLLIAQLAKQGIYPDEVEFSQDYALPALGEQSKSPYAKFYRALNTRQQFSVVSGLPMVNYKGQLLDVGFVVDIGGYRSKTNVFDAFVTNEGLVTAGCLNDQPDGRKSGQIARWSPTLYLNSKEVKANKAVLLDEDPLNSSYAHNTLEWDYGICKRRIRLIEGHTLGTWVFPVNPNGDVRIVYNQAGDFPVKLGIYAVNANEEQISKTVFDSVKYPFEVSDSQTFYPDANPETTSVDGYVSQSYGSGPGNTWANAIAGAGTGCDDSSVDATQYIYAASTTGRWCELWRLIFLFDTHGLGSGTAVSAATLSLRGADKADTLGITPNINVYSSAPASNTALANGDFDSLGSTAFCDTPITYANWRTDATFNNFALNATGIVAINTTGITKLGTRNANYDVAASPPVWKKDAFAYLDVWSADMGTGYKPKLVVTYSAPQTYNETGRMQVVNAVVGQSVNQIMTEAREQVILAAQGGNGVRHYYEALEQVILTAQGKLDQLTMVETRGQAIPVIIGKADLQTMLESRGQIVLAVQGHTDQAIFNELSRLQVVLAAIGGNAGLKYTEVLEQIILALQGHSDIATANETSHLQTILAALGKTDSAIFTESREQVIAAVIGESDIATFLEAQGQIITAVISESDNSIYLETEHGQIIIVEIGGSAGQLFYENALQIIKAVIGEAENLTFTDTGHEQTIIAEIDGNAIQHYIETGLLQTIIAEMGSIAGLHIDETGKTQTIIVRQGEDDSVIFTEHQGQVVIVIQGHSDLATFHIGMFYTDGSNHLIMSGSGDDLIFTSSGNGLTITEDL